MSLRNNNGGGSGGSSASQDNRTSVILADDQIEELREKFVKVYDFIIELKKYLSFWCFFWGGENLKISAILKIRPLSCHATMTRTMRSTF